MHVSSDKLTEGEPRQQANHRFVEIQENEYRDMFDFESFCGNDFWGEAYTSSSVGWY